jgi:hypothetical protein
MMREVNYLEACGEIKIVKKQFGMNITRWILQTTRDYNPEIMTRVFIDYCPFCGQKLEAPNELHR